MSKRTRNAGQASLDKYEVGKVLGAGTYGEARLVFREGKAFVAKIQKYNHVASTGREHLKREVHIMAILGAKDHPHLVRFRHSIIDGSFWCIIILSCDLEMPCCILWCHTVLVLPSSAILYSVMPCCVVGCHAV